MGRSATPRVRRDGWTAQRQLGFLASLSDTKSVTAAASSVSMSRESAYRLRARPHGALLAALWDRILQPDAAEPREGHSHALTDDHLARLLGTYYRRERGDFASVGSAAAESLPA